MFLTLFYIISSYIRMWQLQSIRTKLLQHISSGSCVTFYRMSNNSGEFIQACSSHCKEPEKAFISDVLFVKDKACACALKPLLELCLSTWRAPPPSPARIAFVPNVKPKFHTDSPDDIKPSTSLDPDTKQEYLNILLECDLEGEDPEELSILPESETWKILAWRMEGSRLALALHGDIYHLTHLASTFLYYDTPISRIMTVKFEGYPINLNDDECKAIKKGNINGSPRHCSKYITMLQKITEKNLSITSTPDEPLTNQNHIDHTQISPSKDIESAIEPISEPVIEKSIQDDVTCTQNGINGDAPHESPIKHPLVSRKSDLKLELNSRPECERTPSRTVTISRMKTLEKKSHSKSSLLDEPISTKERRNKGGASCPSLPTVKPPNVLIYSDSAVTRENISRTLRSVLDPDRYAIYASGNETSLESAGSNGAALLVAGGALSTRASAALLSAFFSGARILSLCSDFLISVLPYYQTAEVRERELVSFTYENWKSVKLLHNVFCYQASPARRQFSQESKTHPAEYKGHGNHVLKVEVLAAEQTWHTPSLLQACDEQSGGMAVFSQVHLELDAREYLGTEAISAEQARLGVLRKILAGLGMSTIPSPIALSLSSEPCYTPAYFLGTYERKIETAESVAVGCLKLIKPKEKIPPASSTLTPLLLHACPENFSTLLYYQELTTKHFGRLVIYSDILSSTQIIMNEQSRTHGLVIMSDRQTKGTGRSGTTWISPQGCLTFSLQIITSMKDDVIARRASLLQHLTAVSFVLAIRSLPGYEDIDIGIKWPNDIYYAKKVKLGGIILNTFIMGYETILNIGLGINLNNTKPTCCINDIIKEHNPKLEPFEHERLLALTLNHLEVIYEKIKNTNDFTEFYELYYKYWLHSDQEVLVVEEGDTENQNIKCHIQGIDENGYLRAIGPSGEISLRPDGNTFDMMKGLITPKLST